MRAACGRPTAGARAHGRSTALRVACYRDAAASSSSSSSTRSAARRSSPPPQLAPVERESLSAYLRAAGLAEDTAAAGQVPQHVRQAAAATISRGLAKEERDLAALEGAMLLAEQLFHASGGADGVSGPEAAAQAAAPQTVDMWQPIFASAGGFPRLLYIPVPEFFDMHRALPEATAISIDAATGSIDASASAARASDAAGGGGRINIVTELGPFVTHFLGTCSWLDGVTMAYEIGRVRVDVAGRSLSFGLAGPLRLANELTFFMAAPQLACARSKLGGTMLLAADPEPGRKYFDAW